MSEPLLRAHALRRAYGRKTVVDVDHLAIDRGEIVALLGPNGSGKSTLFRLLLLVERADAGEIFIDGRAVTKRDRAARRKLAGVFQKPFLFAGTVRDNLAFGLKENVSASECNERVSSAAAEFGLTSVIDTPVRTLSGGEAQRVALARAIALQPDLLLLDEPTANLDITIKRTFRDDVERAARAHAGAVLLITHDPAEAFALADRVIVMDGGRIVQSGTPHQLLDDPRSAFVASLTGAELLLDGSVVEVAQNLVHVDVGGALVWATVSPDHDWAPERGARVHVAYRPEDVMISTADAYVEISARNQYRLRIAGANVSGGLVRMRLEGKPNLTALVTRASVESLGLRPGREVVAHMKATALQVLRSR